MENVTGPCDDGDEVVGHRSQNDVFVTTGAMDPVQNESTSTPLAKDIPTERKTRVKRERRKMLKKKSPVIDHSPASEGSAASKQGLTESESSQKKMKRKLGDSGARVDSEEEKKTKKQKGSQRPNYFVSIPITNAQISAAVVEVQESVLQQEPRLVKAMIPAPTLHMTLLVTHLASQEQISLAATALDKAMPSLAELLVGRALVLPFSGVGHFRKEVVFVGLAPGQHRDTLEKLAEVLQRCFEEQGLLQGECRGFEPHLTIMKLSKAPKLRSQGLKRVNPDLFSSYTDRFFGDQRVDRLDLCSMLKKKQEDGYYHTESSLQLDLVRSPLTRSKRTSGHQHQEPSEAELQRVSKRLVEDAVNRALNQYKQETLQNGGGPNTAAVPPPENTKESTAKLDTSANSTTDSRK
ncbi:A-kinase anchor protein 7 isoform X1 [Gadus chalcogrammus]|uniref:A-kinase anchor protein 7 isoform X1 n=1 Tax=Gadus chalcogrammus TaxID=1042646 RepID=UPI0024C4CFC4|nr:A-kinase anchor protein 7 isoform X1 [Gadus chalcogrammus]